MRKTVTTCPFATEIVRLGHLCMIRFDMTEHHLPTQLHSNRLTHRLGEVSGIANCIRVEEYQIGPIALTDRTSISQAESFSGKARHLPDGVR